VQYEFLKFYDFTAPAYRLFDNMSELFECFEDFNDDKLYEYLYLPGAIVKDYLEYRIENNLDKTENSEDDVFDKKYDNDDNYNHLPYNGIASDVHDHAERGSCGYDNFHNIFNKTIANICIKKIIEYIEDNGIKEKYNKKITLDEIKNIMQFNEILYSVIEHYEDALFDNNMNKFCDRCANFGHDMQEVNCIFYYADREKEKREFNLQQRNENKFINKKLQRKKMKKQMRIERRLKDEKTIKKKDKAYDEEQTRIRELNACVCCKSNRKKLSCPENACRKCCSTDHQGHSNKHF